MMRMAIHFKIWTQFQIDGGNIAQIYTEIHKKIVYRISKQTGIT